MAIDYQIQAQIVDIQVDSPRAEDVFMVDTSQNGTIDEPSASHLATHAIEGLRRLDRTPALNTKKSASADFERRFDVAEREYDLSLRAMSHLLQPI
jgi:hypothetical protein